jgi:hypothetical protein
MARFFELAGPEGRAEQSKKAFEREALGGFFMACTSAQAHVQP